MTTNHTSQDDFLNNKELVNSNHLKELPSDSLLDGLLSKRITAAVIGLGPEGRSLALELAADMEVFCFDTDKETLTRFQSTMNTVLSQLSVMTQSTTFSFAAQVKELKKATVFFINASSDKHLCEIEVIEKLLESLRQVGPFLKKGDTVIIGSSCFIGCTEEVYIPCIESASGLKCGVDLQLAFVPLRSMKYPDSKTFFLPLIVSSRSKKTVKVVSDLIKGLSGISPYRAKSIRTAEAMLQYGGLSKSSRYYQQELVHESSYWSPTDL
jgi:UDP-N-acetyl-D-glucosamine/UDP-N-acetyl-D-galactosamine dehydrogenase